MLKIYTPQICIPAKRRGEESGSFSMQAEGRTKWDSSISCKGFALTYMLKWRVASPLLSTLARNTKAPPSVQHNTSSAFKTQRSPEVNPVLKSFLTLLKKLFASRFTNRRGCLTNPAWADWTHLPPFLIGKDVTFSKTSHWAPRKPQSVEACCSGTVYSPKTRRNPLRGWRTTPKYSCGTIQSSLFLKKYIIYQKKTEPP